MNTEAQELHRIIPGAQRVAMLPSVVRMLLTAFLEDVAARDGSSHAED